MLKISGELLTSAVTTFLSELLWNQCFVVSKTTANIIRYYNEISSGVNFLLFVFFTYEIEFKGHLETLTIRPDQYQSLHNIAKHSRKPDRNSPINGEQMFCTIQSDLCFNVRLRKQNTAVECFLVNCETTKSWNQQKFTAYAECNVLLKPWKYKDEKIRLKNYAASFY